MIKVFQSFSEIRDVWNNLVAKSQTATFFQTFEWQTTWWKHFGRGKLWLLGVVEESNFVALASFEEKEGIWDFLGTSEVLAGERVTDFGDIVVQAGKEAISWQQILKFCPRPWDLHFLRETSKSLSLLKKLGGKIKVEGVAPYLLLPSSWENYLAILPKKAQQELERKIRKFLTIGSLKTSSEPTCQHDLEHFFYLLRSSSFAKERFLTGAMEDFFRDLAKIFGKKGMLKICFLEVEGKRVAATLSFIFQKELLLYNSGFDPTFAFLSPGLVLKALLIKKAIKEGQKRLDFLQGGERYKYELGGKDQRLYEVKFNL